jgi:hypothetical protein
MTYSFIGGCSYWHEAGEERVRCRLAWCLEGALDDVVVSWMVVELDDVADCSRD